ncbi:uncharacterized protein G2W53_004331 [Senna tora]|uniref:Uncharacterized protein n=1 Tax=Senna tora TaxID=362788 RepID=A0A834XAG0_9FABA|nr:uncharacterized protein G2W53_004331 [Senna tora]
MTSHTIHPSFKSTGIPKYIEKRWESHSSIKSTRITKYNAKRSIQSRFLVQNVHSQYFTHLPCDHDLHSGFKSTRIPKYNAKRLDLTNLLWDQESHLSIKSTRITKYNAKRLRQVDTPSMRSRSHSSIKSTQIPKYNAKRLALLDIPSMRSRVAFELYVHSDSQLQREAIGLTHLCDNTFELAQPDQTSIGKSTRIPKYNTRISALLDIPSMRSRVAFELYVHSDSQLQREAIGLTHLCDNTFELVLLEFF